MRTTQRPVQSTRSGVVTWLAAPASVVHGGDMVASVGRPEHLEVVVEDKSGAWKSLKPNARVLALVQRKGAASTPQPQVPERAPRDSGIDTPPAAGSPRVVSGAAPRAIVAPAPGDEDAVSIPTLARVLFVAPPPTPGKAARIRIAVHNPPADMNNNAMNHNANGLSARAFAPGMPVFFSVAKPGKTTTIRIPTAAVRRGENGKTFVAVLAPVAGGAPDRPASQCRVEGREVHLAPGENDYNRVKSGLKEGERLALTPGTLYDFTLAYGADAIVRVEQI